MNPMTNMKNVIKLSEQELKTSNKTSWHDQYKDSAWIFIGGLSYDMSEGDIICVFSQFGEVVNINLVRDKATGKPKGFCFLCYEDQRSTVLAVDNLNGIKLLKRTIRVDHVQDYKVPKESKKNKIDEETRLLQSEGCGPSRVISLESHSPTTKVTSKNADINNEDNAEVTTKQKKAKKKKSKKKKKKKEKRKKELNSSDSNSDDESDSGAEKIKKKKKQKKSSNENSSSDDSEIKKSKKKKKKRKQKKDSSSDSSSNSDSDISVKKEKVDLAYDETENQFLQKSERVKQEDEIKKERRDDSERRRGEKLREGRRTEEHRNDDRSRRDNRERYNDDRNRFKRENDVKYASREENRHEYSHKKDYNNYDRQRSADRDYGRRHERDYSSHERKRRHSPERHYDRKKYRN